jgi:hypothetical protein
MYKSDWLLLANKLMTASVKLRRAGAPAWIEVLKLARLCLFRAASLSRVRRVLTPGVVVDQLPPEEFRKFFRFSPEHFEQLLTCLQIPNYQDFGNNCPSRKCVLMLLMRLAYPCRLVNIASAFGVSECYASRVITYTAYAIYNKFGHLLTFMPNKFPPEALQKYVCLLSCTPTSYLIFTLARFITALSNKGCPLPNVFAFVDGTCVLVARPVRRQEHIYNGRFR